MMSVAHMAATVKEIGAVLLLVTSAKGASSGPKATWTALQTTIHVAHVKTSNQST